MVAGILAAWGAAHPAQAVMERHAFGRGHGDSSLGREGVAVSATTHDPQPGAVLTGLASMSSFLPRSLESLVGQMTDLTRAAPTLETLLAVASERPLAALLPAAALSSVAVWSAVERSRSAAVGTSSAALAPCLVMPWLALMAWLLHEASCGLVAYCAARDLHEDEGRCQALALYVLVAAPLSTAAVLTKLAMAVAQARADVGGVRDGGSLPMGRMFHKVRAISEPAVGSRACHDVVSSGASASLLTAMQVLLVMLGAAIVWRTPPAGAMDTSGLIDGVASCTAQLRRDVVAFLCAMCVLLLLTARVSGRAHAVDADERWASCSGKVGRSTVAESKLRPPTLLLSGPHSTRLELTSAISPSSRALP